MQHLERHLDPETLARLVDEIPDAAESEHLERCAACRGELAEMRAQTDMLAELPAIPAPDRVWTRARHRLVEEGLISVESSTGHDARWRPATWMLRAAAYLGLFLAGAATTAALGGARGNGLEPAGPLVAADAVEAERLLRDAEEAYVSALGQYQALTGAGLEGDPAARLAALEGILLSTGAALEAAPADPMINGYYLSAIGQREAMLRQIAAAGEPWY
jgi:hypothetical protein